MIGRRSGWILALAVLALVIAGCDTTATSPQPTGEEAPAGIVIGCISIEAAECQAAAEQVLAALPPGGPRPFDIQISLWGCPNGDPCPRAIAVRGGLAYVEYAGGRDTLTYSLGGVPPILGPLDNHFTDALAPTSPRIPGAGPVAFQLGHCGLGHVVDFDGSFWVPVGQVDGDASGFINADSGQMRLLGPNLAQYEGAGGFVVRLVRFPGAKQFWLCA